MRTLFGPDAAQMPGIRNTPPFAAPGPTPGMPNLGPQIQSTGRSFLDAYRSNQAAADRPPVSGQQALQREPQYNDILPLLTGGMVAPDRAEHRRQIEEQLQEQHRQRVRQQWQDMQRKQGYTGP